MIYYFSGSGHSLAVAEKLAGSLGCGLTEIGGECGAAGEAVAVVVFPVYCQNIPEPVKAFLRTLTAKYVVLIATYGKIAYGNVLYEARKLTRGEIIAGAYIPIGHTFLSGDDSFDAEFLQPIARRIRSPQRACIPKAGKDPLADIFPGLRSRIGVKIIKNDRCSNCGLCEARCPVKAIKNGRIGHKCIRCLRCVTNCPQKALRYENIRILDRYLKGRCKEEYVLYL